MSLGGEELRSARAWAHPVRLRILSLLTGIELSAAEVARELDITQANASYHLRRLADAGELEVASTEKVRGGIAKKYRYVARVDLERQKGLPTHGPDPGRMQQVRQALDGELRRRIPAAAKGDNFFADAEVWLTPDDLKKVRDLLGEVSLLVHDRALEPRADGAEHVSFTTWIFAMERGDETR
ncbi:hypothetical protein GCM10027599_29370 [Yimella radicis]